MQDIDFFENGLVSLVESLHRTKKINPKRHGPSQIVVEFKVGYSRTQYGLSYDAESEELKAYSFCSGENLPDRIIEGLTLALSKGPEVQTSSYGWKVSPEELFNIKNPENVSAFLIYEYFLEHNPKKIQNWYDMEISRDELADALISQGILSEGLDMALQSRTGLIQNGYLTEESTHFKLTDYGIGQYMMIVEEVMKHP